MNTSNTNISFTNSSIPKTILQIGVMRSATAAFDFAQRGTPTLSIGKYHAFQQYLPADQQITKIPCIVRILLANNDTVIASWCSSDATRHSQQFEKILASYQDHNTTSIHANVIPKLQ